MISLYHWLKRSFGMDVQIFISSALKHVAEDFDMLQELMETGHIQKTPAGTSDYYYIINYAVQTDTLILTNDRFKDWKEKYPQFKEEIEKRRVSYLWDQRKGRFFLGEYSKEVFGDQVDKLDEETKKKVIISPKLHFKPSGIVKPETNRDQCGKDFISHRALEQHIQTNH